MERAFSKEQKNKIWKKYFGNKKTANDVFGRKVSFNNAQFDHTYPYALGGKTIIKNGMPLAPESNEEKYDDLKGMINGKSFRVEHKNGIGTLYVNGVKKSIN